MSFQRKIPVGIEDEILNRVRNGHTHRAVGKYFGISETHVGRIARSQGERRKSRLTLDERRQILALNKEGLPVYRIAQQVGRSRDAVKRALEANAARSVRPKRTSDGFPEYEIALAGGAWVPRRGVLVWQEAS